MTPKTPRESLEAIKSDTRLPYSVREDMCIPTIQTAILTALREAGHLRTPGTVEVCSRNPVVGCIDYAGRNDKSAEHCKVFGCPLKQVTK